MRRSAGRVEWFRGDMLPTPLLRGVVLVVLRDQVPHCVDVFTECFRENRCALLEQFWAADLPPVLDVRVVASRRAHELGELAGLDPGATPKPLEVGG